MAAPAVPNHAPTQSPLKQVNATPAKPVPLFDSQWAELTANPSLLANKSTLETTRYFQDLFCLKPNGAVLSAALSRLTTEQVVREYKNNITLFFTNAVKVLKETDRGDIRRANVVETIIPFLRNILSRTYDKPSYQLMVLLAGSLERADAVFTDLVAAIDITLQDVSSTLELRHRTLQLALVLVGGVGQGSLTAYFLRRDLFSTLVRFMADTATAAFAYESVLLLGILANFRKHEARNPYLVRIEDLVDDSVMANILDVVEQVCTSARASYTAIVDDAPPSFVASLSSLVSSLRLSELLSGFGSLTSLSLPPPVTPGPSAPGSPNFKGKGKATEEELAVEPNGTGPGSGAASPAGSLRGDAAKPAMSPSLNGDRGAARPALGTPRKSAVAREENAFRAMPPETVAILLPFYNLLASNDVFGQLVFVSHDGAPPPLPPALISLASYVFCHAAVSARAQAYSRLCLVLLLLLIEKADEGRMTRDEVEVRLCRQRLPTLPHSSAKRAPIAAILDSAVAFLQHNLHKRLDAESYILCLRLVQRAMQQLKAERVRLEYDWVRVWRAVLTLAGFVLAKEAELVRAGVGVGKLEELMGQVFVCLSFAGYWGDAFFEPRGEGRRGAGEAGRLMYELVHAEAVLQALATRIERHPLPREGGGAKAAATPALYVAATTPAAAADGVPVCVANVLTIVRHFRGAVEELRGRTSPEEPEAGEVMSAIEEALPGLELVESSALGDLRGWREWEAVARGEMGGGGQEGEGAWDGELVEVVCGDAVGLVSE